MPLNIRSTSVKISVLCFFCIAILGQIKHLSPLCCAKRAAIAGFLAYLATSIAVRIINSILINEMVKSLTRKNENNEQL